MQVFMPIGQGLAASTIGGNDGPGTNTFLLCTQYGIQLKTIAPDAAPDDVTEGRSTTKALWDCSICQLQMGVDTPKPQLFTFKIEIFEKYNVETAQDSIVAEIHITRPNPPRAPPAA